MSSRDTILQAIRQNKPEQVSLALFTYHNSDSIDNLSAFINAVNSVGGTCKMVSDLSELANFQTMQRQKGLLVVNGVSTLENYNIIDFKNRSAIEVQDVDTVILKGTLAVAENGAVWLNEKDIVNRVLPFICQHLVLLINSDEIVGNMHEALEKINLNKDGYGLFIAGPSKTADIEQSLVVGAHGALSLQVFIVA